MTSAAPSPALKVSEVNGGKYPIIHVRIKTQRSGLMKAFGGGGFGVGGGGRWGSGGGGAVIPSNREGSAANTALIKPLC